MMGFPARQTLLCPSPSTKARLAVAKLSKDMQPLGTLRRTSGQLVYGERLSGL